MSRYSTFMTAGYFSQIESSPALNDAFLMGKLSYFEATPKSHVMAQNLSQSCGASCVAIPYNNLLAKTLRDYMASHLREDFCMLTPPSYFSEEVRGELKRYMVAIQAYIDSFTHKDYLPIIPKCDLVEGILDKNYSEFLKKFRQKSYLNSSGNIFVDPEESFSSIPRVRITDIGDIFCYRYCFFWEEEEPDDYKYAFLPVYEPKKKIKKELEEALVSMLSEVKLTEYVEEKEILLTNSGTACLAGFGQNPIKSHVYKEKEKFNRTTNSPLRALREVVKVSPQGYRDSSILSVPHSNSIKWIEKQMQDVCEQLKHSAYFRDREKIDRSMNSLFRKHHYFLNRDIRKEGISKPRYLLKIIFRALSRVFPNMPCLSVSKIYDEWLLYVEGQWRVTNRGHGLGMANALTTIMQCLCFEYCYTKFKASYPNAAGESIEAIFYNDDCVIAFDDDEVMIEYIDFEQKQFEIFGLFWHKTKTHWGHSMVFLENYFIKDIKTINDKTSLSLYGFYLAFAAVNIIHAKQLTRSLNMPLENFPLEPYLAKLESFWGYELYPDEFSYPYIFGGWLSFDILGTDASLYFLKEENYKMFYRAYKATSYTTKMCFMPNNEIKRKRNTPYINPINHIYPDISLGPHGNKVVECHKNLYDASKNYYRTQNADRICKYFEFLKKKRLEQFHSSQRPKDYKMDELIELIITENYTTDFVLSEEQCRPIKEGIFYDSTKLHDIHIPNSMLSYLKYYNKDKIAEKVLQDPRFALKKPEVPLKLERVQFDTQTYLISEGLHGDILWRLLTHGHYLRIQIENKNMFNQHMNPQRLAEATYILYGTPFLYRIGKPKFQLILEYLYHIHESDYWEAAIYIFKEIGNELLIEATESLESEDKITLMNELFQFILNKSNNRERKKCVHDDSDNEDHGDLVKDLYKDMESVIEGLLENSIEYEEIQVEEEIEFTEEIKFTEPNDPQIIPSLAFDTIDYSLDFKSFFEDPDLLKNISNRFSEPAEADLEESFKEDSADYSDIVSEYSTDFESDLDDPGGLS